MDIVFEITVIFFFFLFTSKKKGLFDLNFRLIELNSFFIKSLLNFEST